jgi:hypothetical protein
VEKTKTFSLAAVVILATLTLAIVLARCGHESRPDADPTHMQPHDDASAY